MSGADSLEESFLPLLRDAGDLEGLTPCLALSALIHSSKGEKALVHAIVDEFERETLPALHYRARYLPDISRALVAIQDRERLEPLFLEDDQVSYPHDRHCLVTARAISAEAIGDWDVALELYTEAAQRWSRFGFSFEEGQALLGAGRCLISTGRRDEASSRLRPAREIFATLGAKPLLEQTDDHLKQTVALSS